MQDNSQTLSMLTEFARQKHVKRWNGRKTLNDFNLLDHAARVANITRILCKLSEEAGLFLLPELKLHALEYALYHDFGEVYLNDTPSTVKAKHPELDCLIKSIEHELLAPLQLSVTAYSQAIVKYADIIDCLHEALLEKRLGSRDAEYDVVIANAMDKIHGVISKYGLNKSGNDMLVLVFQHKARECAKYLFDELSVDN